MRGNGTRSYSHVENSVCPGCGGTRFSKLGEYVTEVLEKIPGRPKVIRHIRPKLSCRCCERIMQRRCPICRSRRAGRVRVWSKVIELLEEFRRDNPLIRNRVDQ
jgi:transposase